MSSGEENNTNPMVNEALGNSVRVLADRSDYRLSIV
jgi:hypothetical protein